jgi:hypothetical protein
METSDTEIILKAIFEGVELAAVQGKRVTYVFDCGTDQGPKQIAFTIDWGYLNRASWNVGHDCFLPATKPERQGSNDGATYHCS